jgi:hypothetical protein
MSLAMYTGQAKTLRKMAIESLGAEKVSLMSDSDISKWIDDNYAIFWGNDVDGIGSHKPTEEIIVLIPGDKFHELLDQNDIIFVER